MKKYITTYDEYLACWEKLKDRVPFNMICVEIRCKFCFSRNVIKYGHFKNTQRWWCKDCRRKFADNGASPYMKTHNSLVSSALVLYYNGLSLNEIRKSLKKHYYTDFSASTIYSWIHKYTDDAIKNTRKYSPRVGGTWIINISPVIIDEKYFYIADIFDAKTRYLIISQIQENSCEGLYKTAIDKAIQKTGILPRSILTDKENTRDVLTKLSSQINHGITLLYLKERGNNSVLCRINRALHQRNKILQSLKSSLNAELIMNGWAVHYNFFRLHEGLLNRTPSALAQVDNNLDEGWFLIVKHVRDIVKYWQKSYDLSPYRTLKVPMGVYAGSPTTSEEIS